ncbi:MAG: hypothetical protein Q9219_003902 [cf. Caloplaca sp. 3 TL-2023]
MANLSSLLNPAPSLEPDAQPVNAAKTETDRRKQDSPGLPPIDPGSLNLQPAIKSPLDTLADAATSSAPMLSPTTPNNPPFVSLATYTHSTPQSSSRPTSSHFSPPPSLDHSYAPAPTSPTFAPGLQQYHHPTSTELKARRPSETAESSIRPLPPLRGSLHDNESDQNLPPVENVTSVIPAIDAAAASTLHPPLEIYPEDAHPPPVSQSKLSSPGSSNPQPDLALPTTQPEQAQVKTELSETTPDLNSSSIQPPVEMTQMPSEPSQDSKAPDPTPDMKAKPSPTPDKPIVHDPPLKPQPAPSRKRPAPKKGTATTVKPAAKKRKVDKAHGGIETLSPLARSGTPTSSRTSKTPAPKVTKQASVTPRRSSSIANDEDEDDDGVFCICRGPDDHTWMIACDGPCEDWFHGRCINMTEKESQLIEKYFCMVSGPNCTEAGQGETLWKRMCRLDGCRRPARINGTKKSKYCSDEHGCEFMKRLTLQREDQDRNKESANLLPTSTPSKSGRKTNNSFASFDLSNGIEVPAVQPEPIQQQPVMKESQNADANQDPSHPRGGILRAGELKALVTGVNDISEFRKLGDGALSPPPTADPNKSQDIKLEDAPAAEEPAGNPHRIPYKPEETDHLRRISTRRDELLARKQLIDDREVLLALVRERAKALFEELKKKENVKDLCGFDARLVWLDEEFHVWRQSEEGVRAFAERKLGAPTPLVLPEELVAAPAPSHQHQHHQPNGTTTTTEDQRPPGTSQNNNTNGDVPVHNNTNGEVVVAGGGSKEEEEDAGKGICRRRKCERHRHWYRLQLQDMALANEEVRVGMRRLEEEEKGVRDRARVRWLVGGEDGEGEASGGVS